MPAIPTRTVIKQPTKLPARRFTDKPELDPSAVWGLRPDHAAMKESRTLFPSTVVNVDEDFEGQLLVSGKNNRKLGETITKGKFRDYALYGLSLEERATCSIDCHARAFCYGNAMHLARRHRITDLDLFATFLEDEIRTIIAETPGAGLMVRLHVLGDFESVEYVALWADMLDAHDLLACYGYTSYLPKRLGGCDIGDAIESVKQRFPDRFRIRWSSPRSIPDGATIVSKVPGKARIDAGIVCPAQTDATACCGSCGLCWEASAKRDTIVFIKHGPKSAEAAAESEIVTNAPQGASRYIRPIAIPSNITPRPTNDAKLNIRSVAPKILQIEPEYQRDLSAKSIQLIRKIVSEWDWAKFKPPICAETDHGLFVIDGQHTAIAAATHPGIKEIPIVIAPAKLMERRAAAFVSHNRDRLVMTPAQIFYGDLASNDKAAKAAMECIVASGASIPRLTPSRGDWKPGQIAAVGEVRDCLKALGREGLTRVLSICVAATLAPLSKTVMRALRQIMTAEEFASARSKSDSIISDAIRNMPNLEKESEARAALDGTSRFMACAALIAEAVA